MQVLDSRIVGFLLVFTSLADALEEVLLVQDELTCGDILYTRICIANCKLFTLLNVSSWDQELCSASEHGHTIWSAAMIEQVCR